MRDMNNIIVLMAVLGILLLLLFYKASTFCKTSIVEEMSGTVIGLRSRILNEPVMVVKLSNDEMVDVKEYTICPIGSKITLQHVEGNCRNGWYHEGDC